MSPARIVVVQPTPLQQQRIDASNERLRALDAALGSPVPAPHPAPRPRPEPSARPAASAAPPPEPERTGPRLITGAVSELHAQRIVQSAERLQAVHRERRRNRSIAAARAELAAAQAARVAAETEADAAEHRVEERWQGRLSAGQRRSLPCTPRLPVCGQASRRHGPRRIEWRRTRRSASPRPRVRRLRRGKRRPRSRARWPGPGGSVRLLSPRRRRRTPRNAGHRIIAGRTVSMRRWMPELNLDGVTSVTGMPYRTSRRCQISPASSAGVPSSTTSITEGIVSTENPPLPRSMPEGVSPVDIPWIVMPHSSAAFLVFLRLLRQDGHFRPVAPSLCRSQMISSSRQA